MAEKRIVSLLPSSTEIVYALGLGAQLVGRSHECDYPPSVKALPICTEPKFVPAKTSAEIDEQVHFMLHEAASIFRVDAELLRQLQPDVIITQSMCEVCAVSLAEVERVVCDWIDTEAQIVSLEPARLADVLNDVRRVAIALGVPERGDQVVGQLEARLQAICQQTQPLATKPTVACIEWIDPLMAAGNWMPELVTLAGGVNLFGETGKHSPWLTWDDLCAADPDVILLLPCGYAMDRAAQDVPILESKAGWFDLRAVRDGRVYLTDGNQYFNRSGPRLVESLEILAEILQPETFTFGHKGSGWRWYKHPLR